MVSGPSGSGKTTLCRKLAESSNVHYSISCTTRAPRVSEVPDEDYHFLTPAEFASYIEQGEFLEHAQVHGHHYGSLKSEVIGHLQKGVDVVMDIDVQGAAQIRQCADGVIQLAFVDVFVMPPNENELAQRLSGRGTDDLVTIALRMKNALEEMRHWHNYRYLLMSCSREKDFEQFSGIVTAERMRVSRMLDTAPNI